MTVQGRPLGYSAVCPECKCQRGVRGDGAFRRHGRLVGGELVEKLAGNGRTKTILVGATRELCPGSETPSGLW